MAMLFAVLVLGALGSKIPTDADIAARLEDAIRTQLHPESVRVVVKRPSALSTTFEQVDITISGFNASQLPMDAMPASEGGKAAGKGDKPARPGRQIRLMNVRLTCENFVVNGLPVRTLAWQGNDVYLPFQAIRSGVFQISSARAVNGYVLLQEDDLTKFLQTLELPITEPELSISPGECRVDGVVRVKVKLPISLSGQLIARDGAVLYLDDPHLRVSVVPIPKFVSNRVLKDLNPLADLNAAMKLPVPLEIMKTTQQHGTLRIEAALLFPKPPEK